jgi:DnaJ-class molecular chaperone
MANKRKDGRGFDRSDEIVNAKPRACGACLGSGIRQTPKLERDGEGYFDGNQVEDCPTCGGSGQL